MASSQIWTYRDTTLSQRNLAGLAVEAIDGSIGKVDDATNDGSGSFLVIDTGPWITCRMGLDEVPSQFPLLRQQPNLVKAMIEVRDTDM